MIVEEREYRLHHGKLAEFVELYGSTGLPVQLEHLGPLLGYFTVEIGTLNTVVTLWQFDSLADREARRNRMAADPRWQAYLRQMSEGWFAEQASRILTPTVYSPTATGELT